MQQQQQTTLCANYKSGGCRFGSRCRFSHNQEVEDSDQRLNPGQQLSPPSHVHIPCKFFSQSGVCTFGSLCRFQHIEGGSQNKVICKFFSQSGYCHYGVNCVFLHTELDSSAFVLKHSGEEGGEKEEEEVEEELSCGICLESLSYEKRVGLLENCNHPFCLPCIQGWRDEARHSESNDDKESKVGF